MAGQDQKPTVKKTTPPSEWFKNVAKSIGYSSSEVIKEITPNIYNFANDNTTYVKELAGTVADARADSKSVAEMLNVSKHTDILQTALSNAISDIQSGKIYNKERAESFDDDDEFGMFMMDESYDGSVSKSSSDSSPQIINNVKAVKEDNPKLLGAVEAAAQSNIRGTQMMMQQNKEITTTQMVMNHEMGMKLSKGLESIDTNIGQLVNFQNESMSKYIGASIQYYDESLTVMKSSLDKLISMAPAEQQEKKERFDAYGSVFNGGAFNLQGYVENIKRNFEVLKYDNMLVQGITSIFEETDTLERLAKSPLTFISDTITKKIIPMTIRSTMEQLDQSFTSFFPAMMSKFSRLSNSGNPVLEIIGRMFGIDESAKASPNMANYTRGAIPFDGETKRAITDVIPTYLRKIHAVLAGSKEMAFDYESGKWADVDSMKQNYEQRRRDTVRAGYGDQISDLDAMISAVKFQSEKQRDDFKQGMDEFLYKLSRTSEAIAFDTTDPKRTQANQEKMRDLHSMGDPMMDKLLFSMMASLSKRQQMDLVGSGRYKNLNEMRQFVEEMEQSPTRNNAMTILSGLKFDEHIEVDADGKIKKNKATGVNRVDQYGKDDLYYLRTITDTLLEGIKTFPNFSIPTGNGEGDNGPTDRISNRLTDFRSQITNQHKVQSTQLIDYDTDKINQNMEISMGDLDVSDDLIDKLQARIKNQKDMEKSQKTDKFGDLIRDTFGGGSGKAGRAKEALDEIVRKPADVLQKAFEKIDQTMYNIVFGIRDDGRGSFMDVTLDKMTEMFSKVGDFATEKIFLPVADFLTGVFEKTKKGVGENPIVQGIKDGVKFWFVGDKDENGNRKGGVFSDVMNSTKDVVKSISHSITGIGYTDSKGKTHEKNEGSVFGQMKLLTKDIFAETKKHFFGNKDSANPDERRGIMTAAGDMIGNGMADWSNLLFGTQRDPNKTGSEILRQNTTQFVKSAPKGLLGAGAGLAAGTALASGFGILSSFLFPGAPIPLALAGGALGMATGFEGFNKWAFGEIGGNGERIGGALISANTRQFIKDNKTKLIGGAVGGALLSVAVPAVVDMVVPGGGAIANMLSPFGPIGGAIQGMATAMIMKSEGVMSMLFGPKNMNGERMGGLINRLFKKPTGEISKKAVGSKLGLAAVGMAGGATLSSMMGMGVGATFAHMGILGALLASPFGPVGGAVAGLAAAIALGSGKVRKMLFGAKADEEGKVDDVGFVGRMFNMMKFEVFESLKNSAKYLVADMSNWFQNKFLANLEFVTEPIIKGFKDTISGTMKAVKGVVWDIPKFLTKTTVGIIGGAIGKIRDSIKDTVIERAIIKPAGAVVKGAANLVVRPLRFFADTTMRAAVGLHKAGESIQNGFLMVPALLKMGFDRTFETGKAMFKNAGQLFRNNKGEGFSFTERVGRWWNRSREEGKENSSYVTDLFNRHREKLDTYQENKKKIEAEKGQRKDELNEILKTVRDSRYNVDGLTHLSEEDATVARAIKVASSRKDLIDSKMIEKFQVDVFQATGLTLNQLLGANPNKPIEKLSRNQLKYIDMVLKRAKRQGITGDALKKDLKLQDYQMSQVDIAEATHDETKKMRTLLESLAGDFTKVIGNGVIKIGIERIASSAAEDISKSGVPTINYKDILEGNGPLPTPKVDTKPIIKIPEAWDKAKKKVDKVTEQSEGGSIGGAILSATKSIGSRVTSVMSGMTKEVSKLGCGAIVLAKVLAEAGIKMSANEVYSFAEERGFVNPGVGVSSNVFKELASSKGLTYSYSKPTKQGLEKLFRASNMVIARLNSGVGHFVILHSYSPSENNLAIDDPMGKVSGVYNIDQILKMSTHLYAVYKRGLVTSFKKLTGGGSGSKVTPDSSTGGTIGGDAPGGLAPTKNASLLNKIQTNPALNSIIRGIGVLPVLAVRTKEEIENEAEMTKQFVGDNSEMTVNADGVDRPPVTGRLSSFTSPFAMFKALMGVMKGAFGLGKWLFGKGKQAAGAINDKGFKGALKDEASKRKGQVYENYASGNATLIGGLGRLSRKIKPTVAAGTRRAIRGLLSGASNIGTKISQELVQMGDNAARGNISNLNSGYSTAASPDSLMDSNGRLDINNFLKQQSEKIAAEAEANFRGSSVDLQTRIEVNTRHTAQLLGELVDITDKFHDWLKDWLNKFDPCCPMPFGRLGPPGPPGPPGLPGPPGGNVITPPVVISKGDKNTKNDNRKTTNNTVTKGPTVVTTVPIVPVINNRLPKPIKTTTKQPSTKTTTRRPIYNPMQLPTPKVPGLPEPQRTRKVKDAVTGKYRDMDIRDDVIDVKHTEVKDKVPLPDDPTKKTKSGTKVVKPQKVPTPALPLPQGTPVQPKERVPEMVPVGGQPKQQTRTQSQPIPGSPRRTPEPVIIDAEFTEVMEPKKKKPIIKDITYSGDIGRSSDTIKQATTGKPSSGSAKPASDDYLDRFLNQSREEFDSERRKSLEQIDEITEDRIRRDFREGKINQDEYTTKLEKHRTDMDSKFETFDTDNDKVYSKIEKERQKRDKKKARKGKLKSFTKDAGDILMGKNKNLGIAAGADVYDDIGRMTKNMGKKVGKKVGNAGKAVKSGISDGFGKFGKTLSKGIGKTGLKFLGGAATAGALTAGMTALDAKYGYDNADLIMKKDPSEVTKADRAASSTAQSVVGFIPLIDMADEMLGGHAKEWLAKLIVGIGPIWDKLKDTFTKGWEDVKTSVTDKVTALVDGAKEKWEGIKTAIGEKWDNTKTAIAEKVTSIVEGAKEKWEGIKTSIVEKWENTKTAISEKVTSIVEGAKEKWENIKTDISTRWDNTKTAVSEKLKSIIDAAKTKWDGIKTDIGKKWDDTKTAISDKVKGIIDAAKTKWDGIKTDIGKKWDDIKKAIPEKITEIKDKIVDKLGGISISFKGLAGDIATKVKEKILSGIGSLKVKIFGGGETVSLKGERADDDSSKTKAQGGREKLDGTSKLLGMGGPDSNDMYMDNLYGAGGGCAPCKKKKQKALGMGPGSLEGTYYSQRDSRWSGQKLSDKLSFGDAGCGPTAIANVVTDLTGEKVLPTEAAKYAKKNGFIDPEKGTDSALFGDFANSKGVNVNATDASIDNVRSQLAMGNKVILRGEKGKNYTNSGHYIIADDIDPKGNIKIKDPLGKERSGTFNEKDIQNGLTHAFVASTTGAGNIEVMKKLLGNKTFGQGSTGFINPMSAGRLSSPYGWRNDPHTGERKFHYGIDLANGGGTEIQASADGEVIVSGPHNSYGEYIIIRHNINGQEMTTVYAHLARRKVGVGAKVKQGQSIGIEGTTGKSTGNHLHFEIHKGPYKYGVNNVDPLKLIKLNDPTPQPFDGTDLGNLVTGTAGAAMAAWSLSNITSKFDTSSIYPSVLTNLPNAMKSLSEAFLFGAPVAGISAALFGNKLTGDSGSVPILSGNENAEKVWNFFKSQGFSNHSIAGIMGNLQQESGMDPAKRQTGGTAKGIAQWEGGRWTNLVNKAKAAGVSEWDLGIQLKHIVDELNGDDPTTASILNKRYGGLDGLKLSADYKKATEIFQESFERAGKPMYANRYGYAEQYFNKYNNGTTGGGLLAQGGPDIVTEIDKIIDSDELMHNVTGGQGEYTGVERPMKAPSVQTIPNQTESAVATATSTPTPITAKGFGNIESIQAENEKYEQYNESKPSTSTTSITQVFGEGGDNPWCKESVERALHALETIATNTGATKDGLTSLTTNITNINSSNNNNVSDQRSSLTNGANQQSRSMNARNIERNQGILVGRK